MGKLSSDRIACVLMLSIALAASGGLVASADDDSGIPKECQDTGVNLQSVCSSDITKASNYFGIAPGSSGVVSQSQVDTYLADAGNKVSSGCCTAAVAFNAASCNCNPKVVELAKSFVGGDTTLYNTVYAALAQSCGFAKVC